MIKKSIKTNEKTVFKKRKKVTKTHEKNMVFTNKYKKKIKKKKFVLVMNIFIIEKKIKKFTSQSN